MDISSIILIIIAVIGNIFLFSGKIFNDFALDPFAWLCVLCAVVADIICIKLAHDIGIFEEMDIFNIGGFLRNRRKRKLIKKSEQDSKEKTPTLKESAPPPEKVHKVDLIIKKYGSINTHAAGKASPFHIDPDLINREVVSAVRSYKDRVADVYEKYLSISNELKTTVSCPGCDSFDERYDYLTAHEDRLSHLGDEINSCLKQIESHKIELLNEDIDLMRAMNCAFYLLRRTETITARSLITHSEPLDLMLFKYEKQPVTLFFKGFYFSLFSNVILVFDEHGVFSTAVDPSALQINVERKDVLVERNGTPVSVGNGYFRPEKGTAKNNDRNDTYEKLVIEFTVANAQSSLEAILDYGVGDSFERIGELYTRKCNGRHTSIPKLLMLMKKLSGDESDENKQIDEIIKICNARPDTNNYFCRLIE